MSTPALPTGAHLERLLEEAEIAQYQDFFRALPQDVGERLGVDVATGALYLSETASGPVGQFTFGSTLSSHRRRGAQSALIARRVADARAAGARWVASETDEARRDRPNPSTRNLVRLGFPVVYVRANWGPPKPEG